MTNRENLYADIEFAQKLCQEINSGNPASVKGLYQEYHHKFFKLAQKRLYKTIDGRAEEVVANFWKELLTGKALCAYEGRKGASLQTFLTGILLKRIIDANRIIQMERNLSDLKSIRDKKDGGYDNISMEEQGLNNPESPEDIIIKDERNKIVNEALLLLSEIHPRDARLMWWHLEGLRYEEMAAKELEIADGTLCSDNIKRKEISIRKQFTRARTGTKARFTEIFRRVIEDLGLSIDDFLNKI